MLHYTYNILLFVIFILTHFSVRHTPFYETCRLNQSGCNVCCIIHLLVSLNFFSVIFQSIFLCILTCIRYIISLSKPRTRFLLLLEGETGFWETKNIHFKFERWKPFCEIYTFSDNLKSFYQIILFIFLWPCYISLQHWDCLYLIL